MDHPYSIPAHNHAGFPLRRALERLREGLYDPLAVRLLTARHDTLDARLRDDWRRLEAGETVHLCVCGAYGHGKSHTLTYLRERCLEQGYAVSAINLDPRQTPLHLIRLVYRALLATMTLPATEPGSSGSWLDAWCAWAVARTGAAEAPAAALQALLPEAMPHTFKATCVALAQPTLHVPPGQRVLRQYRDYRPAEFAALLQRTLMGETVPVARLRSALKYRQVAFYRQAPLALSGDEPFVQMLESLPQLLQRMGYKGWVLLFDEAEAITQVRLPLRARSYRLLHRLCYPAAPRAGLYPVFACTPGFFQQLHEEDYSLPYFDRNYAQAWRELSVYHLRGLTRAAWRELCGKLIAVHAAAYAWPAAHDPLLARLQARLPTLPLQDARATLKVLVDELDQAQQQVFFTQRFAERD